MFKKYNWQQPIYKNDLLMVLLNGFLACLLGGILGGLLDYLFGIILNLPLSFSLILFSFMIGTRMNKGYYTYHILYSVLSIVFMLLAILFSNMTYVLCLLGGNAFWSYLGTGTFYLNSFFGFIIDLVNSIRIFSFIGTLIAFINVAVVVYSFYFCYKLVKKEK